MGGPGESVDICKVLLLLSNALEFGRARLRVLLAT